VPSVLDPAKQVDADLCGLDDRSARDSVPSFGRVVRCGFAAGTGVVEMVRARLGSVA